MANRTMKEHNVVERTIQQLNSHLENFSFSGMSVREEEKWWIKYDTLNLKLQKSLHAWHVARGR